MCGTVRVSPIYGLIRDRIEFHDLCPPNLLRFPREMSIPYGEKYMKYDAIAVRVEGISLNEIGNFCLKKYRAPRYWLKSFWRSRADDKSPSSRIDVGYTKRVQVRFTLPVHSGTYGNRFCSLAIFRLVSNCGPRNWREIRKTLLITCSLLPKRKTRIDIVWAPFLNKSARSCVVVKNQYIVVRHARDLKTDKIWVNAFTRAPWLGYTTNEVLFLLAAAVCPYHRRGRG